MYALDRTHDVAKKRNISAIYYPIRFAFEVFEAAKRRTSIYITYMLRTVTTTFS